MNDMRKRERRVDRGAFVRSAWMQSAGPALGLSLALLTSGCRTQPKPVSDDQLASTVQSQLQADTALSGQPIQPQVADGVVVLNGTVANDAQREIAARDAAGVAGVKRVINSITLGTPQAPNASATAAAAPPQPVPAPAPVLVPRVGETPRQRREREAEQRREAEQQQAQQQQAANGPAPVVREQPAYQPAPAAPLPPPPPPAPAFKNVVLAPGSTVPVRITQTLDSASTQAGSTFSGVVESDIMADGLVAIPAGATVSGLVSDVKDAAHFKGSSELTVTLSTINRRGERLAVTTDPYTVTGKGRGTNTAEKVGGGAAVGAILGGIFGGGKGAAIGAAAGGGTGAGVQAVTRGQQVQIASETVVRFHLASALPVRVRTDGGRDRGDNGSGNPGLGHHDAPQ